jgi:hypothetical protein
MAETPNISGLQKKVDTSIVKEELPANMSTARLPEPPAAVKEEPAAPPAAVPPVPQAGTPPAGEGNGNSGERQGSESESGEVKGRRP